MLIKLLISFTNFIIFLKEFLSLVSQNIMFIEILISFISYIIFLKKLLFLSVYFVMFLYNYEFFYIVSYISQIVYPMSINISC